MLLPGPLRGNKSPPVHEIKLSASGMLPQEKTILSIVVTTNVSFPQPGLLDTEHISPRVIPLALYRFGMRSQVAASSAIMAILALCAASPGLQMGDTSPRVEITVRARRRCGRPLPENNSISMISSTGYFLLPGRQTFLHPHSVPR